jgi:hypothetical protein
MCRVYQVSPVGYTPIRIIMTLDMSNRLSCGCQHVVNLSKLWKNEL